MDENRIAIESWMNDWVERIKHQDDGGWVTLDLLPKYKFKNLRMKGTQFGGDDGDLNELNFTLKYDEVVNL